MVDPILLLAIPFAAAFLLPLVDRIETRITASLHLATLAFGLVVSGIWLAKLGAFSGEEIDVVTGGWPEPFGIVLKMSGLEAGLCVLAYGTALFAALFLSDREEEAGPRGRVLQLMILVGSAGLIMSRDLFNIFVFIEITSIATYALVLYGREDTGLEAGLKYMLMGAVAAALFLIAVGLLYRMTGTLYLKDMAVALLTGGSVAALGVLVLLAVAMFVELKLFPVNGPAIDLYDGADPAIMALVVGTAVNALFFAFTKVALLFPDGYLTTAVMAVGMVTYVVSNLFALRQSRVRRLLGYSSSAQMGLLVFLWPMVKTNPQMMFAVAMILVSHSLAKAGLLWLAGIWKGEKLEDWCGLWDRRPGLALLTTVLVVSLVALPPFPAFWGKWVALVNLARGDLWWWIIPLLFGAFLELVYYFGWLRHTFRTDAAPADFPTATLAKSAGPVAAALALVVLGGWLMSSWVAGDVKLLPAVMLMAAGAALSVVRGLPSKLLSVMTLVSLAAASYAVYMAGAPAHPLAPLFLSIILGGALLVTFAGLGFPDGPREYHGLFLALTGGLLMVVLSVSGSRSQALLLFFVGWEVMTWTSTLLISRGSSRAGYLYVLFSAAAGMLLLGGLMVAEGTSASAVGKLASLEGDMALLAWILIGAGVVIKLGGWGVHIWAQSAYSDSPDRFTPFLSAVVSKAPVFGIAVLMADISVDPVTTYLGQKLGAVDPHQVLAWVGGITAFAMALLAALQEDAKKLLAYSSIGQVAYIVVALNVFSPLGWAGALYLTVNHFLFKALLFLAIAGVVLRTGTDRMHHLGGLITKMPVTFVSVLIGIIAVSGVPPLSGFAGRWLIYESLNEQEWFFLNGLLMFSTMVAFLYLFRLIHSVFLGQLKTEHREVKEAPWPLLASQVVLMAGIMVMSVWPQALMEPLLAVLNAGEGVYEPLPDVIRPVFISAAALEIEASGMMVTPLGYFNPLAAMLVICALFGIFFVLLLLLMPRSKWVKQSDMVFCGEVPPKPEETHFAHAIFRPYERAYAPLLAPRVTRFWTGVADTVAALVESGRRFYTGSPQTYLLYAVAMIVVLAFLGGV